MMWSEPVFGQTGNDRLIGGEGSDKIFADDGNDVIIANDGEQDKISCGYGDDFVYADPSDIVYYGCEKVRIDR
jgi:Ca2+-binding RTX toxin-like protein